MNTKNIRKAILFVAVLVSMLLSSCGGNDFISSAENGINTQHNVSSWSCSLSGGHHDANGLCVK